MRRRIMSALCVCSLLMTAVSCGEDPQSVDPAPDNTEQTPEEEDKEPEEENKEPEPDIKPEPGVNRLELFEPFPTVDGFPKLDIDPVLIENSLLIVDIVEEYGAAADGKSDDSRALQNAIDHVTLQKDGGIVYMPKGEYMLHDISLKSNVHLHIEGGSVIRMEPSSSNTKLFEMGAESFVNNVAIRGVNGRFTIDLEGMTGAPRVFRLKSVHNFLISDMDIQDCMVEFPMIGLGPDEDMDPEIFGPTQGVIKNCSSFNAHYGYGLIQVQCARKVYFENLYGEGGVVLRFETGENTMNQSQFGGVHDCRGYKIAGKNGNATVMISPHSMHNGIVQIDDIKAESMGIGARIEAGYDYVVNKGEDDEYTIPGGSYDEGSYISNIDCTFGNKAQVKTKHLKFMPQELLDQVPEPYYKTICQPAPSICAVLFIPDYPIKVIGSVKATGYINDAIVTEEAPRN